MDILDDITQNKLDSIVKKEVGALTEGDIRFLKARRDYLTGAQKEVYAEILEADIPVKTPVEETPKVDTNKLSYKELQRKARSLGLPFIGIKKDDLLVSIGTAEGPESSGHPE